MNHWLRLSLAVMCLLINAAVNCRTVNISGVALTAGFWWWIFEEIDAIRKGM